MIRVLIADDSPVVREILRTLIAADDDLEVVGCAQNGRQAVELARELEPDLLLMDVRMPVMDGIEATSAIMAERAVPILVLSAAVLEDTSIAFRAIQAGAIDVVQKPEGSFQAYQDVAQLDLVRRIKLVASVPPIRRGRRRQPAILAPPVVSPAGRLVVIGASTGGPPALVTVLGGFPAEFSVPILAVQHITPGFLQGFVEWLDGSVELHVSVARSGERARSGRVYFAPEDHHLGIAADGRLCVTRGPPRDGHRPSATALFESAAEAFGRNVVGVLLTGMGRDGASGLLRLREAGAHTVCQDEETSIVFGMPGVAVELGAAEVVAPVELIATEIVRALG